MSDYMEETGDPFTGKKKEELKKFLEYMGLTYDEQITHSIVLRKEKEIIATALWHPLFGRNPIISS